MGRLYEVAAPSGTTRFLYDGDALVAEYNTSGTMLHRYVHGNGVDQPLIWYDGGTVNATNRRHMFANWQGSISLITNATGGTVQVNAYDAYGIPNDTNIGRFQYTGQIMISELGIYHYKARAYSPYIGRFLQIDPIGYEDQYNLYAYVGNDPVGRIDPSGEAIWVPVIIAGRCALNSGCRKAVVTAGKAAVKIVRRIAKPSTKIRSGPKPRGANNPKVAKAAREGQKKHREFADKVKKKDGWQSEPRLVDPKTGKTVKPDAVSRSGRPVELKPNTPSGRAKGKSQLKAQERATGKKGRVVYYGPGKN